MHFHLTLPHEFGRIFLNYGPILKSKGVPETREQVAEVYQLNFQLFELFQCKNRDGVWALISRNSCMMGVGVSCEHRDMNLFILGVKTIRYR